MIAFLNYLIEATVGLLLVLAFYKLFLSRETNFSLLRYFLLIGITLSITLPLLHITIEQSKNVAINNTTPPSWIPEKLIQPTQIQLPESTNNINYTDIMAWVYLTGVVVFLVVLVIRLIQLIRILRSSTITVEGKFKTVESDGFSGVFSFFHFIFIGTNTTISEEEKKQIIEHELIHVQKLHSFDMLLLNVLSIVFWFNPIIILYKKTFVQLHEFEADARAVEIHNVNTYCSLLARAALQSVGFSIANHFNNSLTLKRIKMMRTLKQKVKIWRVLAAAAILPVLFFVVACHDQLEEVTELAKHSTMTVDYPVEVKTELTRLQKENPDKHYVVVEPNHDYVKENLKGGAITFDGSNAMSVMKIDDGTTQRMFVIVEYNNMLAKISEESKSANGVFTVVEDNATPVGGREALYGFIQKNLDQTKSSKSGFVYMSMIINDDGSLSNFKILKGLSPTADAEALRVAELLPSWNPAKQNGKTVKLSNMLVFGFGKGQELQTLSDKVEEIEIPTRKLSVVFTSKAHGNETKVIGTVLDEKSNPLQGVNVIVVGGTDGTTTNGEGNFTLSVKGTQKKLAVSFVGFETKVVAVP